MDISINLQGERDLEQKRDAALVDTSFGIANIASTQ
jgi:hypothetical protein